jgi:hypothetical protein
MPSKYLENLPRLVGPAVNNKIANFKNIRVRKCLAIELRFSTTGKSYYSVMYLFEVSKQSVSSIILQVCEAVINILDAYVKYILYLSMFWCQ